MHESAIIAVRFALYADLMILFGLPMFGLYGLDGVGRSHRSALPFRRLLGIAAAAGISLSLVAILLLASSMSGLALADLDRASVEALVTGTAIGSAWQIRMAALLLVVILSLVRWTRPVAALIAASAAAAVAVSTLAWTGHGAAGEAMAGWIQLGADVVHLLASAAWLGALLALLILLLRPISAMSRDHLELTHRALASFSTVGTAVVAFILLSGLINGWMLVGPAHLNALLTSRYGNLLLAKLVLFGAMLALAAANRFRLTPALERILARGAHAPAVWALRRSLALEAGCAIVILMLVAWLGILTPPAAV